MVQRLAHLDLLSYFGDLAHARRKHPADDLVTVLATAEIDGEKLTPDELVLDCDNLFVGGTENTRATAAAGMLAFFGNPGQWQAVSEDRSLLPAARRGSAPLGIGDPDRFDVSRKPNRHLALGTGEHFCLGSTLARAELRLADRVVSHAATNPSTYLVASSQARPET